MPTSTRPAGVPLELDELLELELELDELELLELDELELEELLETNLPSAPGDSAGWRTISPVLIKLLIACAVSSSSHCCDERLRTLPIKPSKLCSPPRARL